MARWGTFMFLVALLIAHQAAVAVAAARVLLAGGSGLTDQKDIATSGGVGNNGIPFGHVGGGASESGDIGGTRGFDRIGGATGTAPNGRGGACGFPHMGTVGGFPGGIGGGAN